MDEATLVLQVKPSGKGRYRPMPLSVEDFIRRWLLHVLPSGFHRVRYYGFLHSHSKVTAAEVRWLIALHNDDLYYLTCSVQLVTALLSGGMRCPRCGGRMISLGYFPPLWYFVSIPRAPPDAGR